MDGPDHPSQNPSTDNMSQMKESAAITQVTSPKASSVQRLIQLMQTVAQTSCRVFCIPSYKKVTCPVQTPQPKTKSIQELLQSSPSTVLILNISNSTLIDCVIGDSYPCAAAERRRLMEESPPQVPAQARCSCCHELQELAQAPSPAPALPAGEQLNISIHSSRLNCVIIGDNNHMHTELSEPFN